MNAVGPVPGRPALPEGPFLVCGLARSGQAACRALVERGQTVIAVDSASPEGAAGLADLGVEVHLDASGEDLVGRARTLVKSPGVPGHAPAVTAARREGLQVIGELEIGWRLVPGRFVAVTGTNGKTTVTEMLGHVLRSCGEPVEVAGNVGRPLTDLVGSTSAGTTVVVEASSFQLEDSDRFAPDVAVLLNVTPDHLDRHGTFEAYEGAKAKIFSNQTGDDVAVVPLGSRFEHDGGAARRVTFGGAGADFAVERGAITTEGRTILPAEGLSVPGHHNLLNAAAAAAAAISHGAEPSGVTDALSNFPGVPHRLELVAETHGVRWFNDSKSTNVDATLTALAALDGRIRLILGGQGKGQDFAPLRAAVTDRCVSLHLIGEDAATIATELDGAGVDVSIDGTLAGAVERIRAAATDGDICLLSPACASFDQFEDFEHRGRVFTALVREGLS